MWSIWAIPMSIRWKMYFNSIFMWRSSRLFWWIWWRPTTLHSRYYSLFCLMHPTTEYYIITITKKYIYTYIIFGFTIHIILFEKYVLCDNGVVLQFESSFEDIVGPRFLPKFCVNGSFRVLGPFTKYVTSFLRFK